MFFCKVLVFKASNVKLIFILYLNNVGETYQIKSKP